MRDALSPDTRGLDPQALEQAVRNLLCECGGFNAGEDLVICREDAGHGWYDATVAEAVAQEAARLGLNVTLRDAPPPDAPQPEEITALIASEASIVYFARIGDQDRFGAAGAAGRRVMVYARNAGDLASDFGRAPHGAMRALKTAVDQVLQSAERIEITCGNGTAMAGRVAPQPGNPADTTVRRFPLGVPAPVAAAGFSGRVALVDSLTPTGNRSYDPPVLPIAGLVFAVVEQGRIQGFEGPAPDVAAIEAHYAHVGDLFGIDPWVVHSWHAGLHPGCPFFPAEGRDRDYWSNTVFSNPRLLHFHTCGTAAPGEISWNLVDASVTLDGVPLWQQGVMRPRNFAPLRESLAEHPALQALFPT